MNVQCIGNWSMCSRVLHPHQLNMMLSCLLMNTYHLGTALEVIKFIYHYSYKSDITCIGGIVVYITHTYTTSWTSVNVAGAGAIRFSNTGERFIARADGTRCTTINCVAFNIST